MGFLHPWNFPGKSTEVGCHFLLWGIFPTLGSNLGLLHCFYCLSHEPRSLASPALAGRFYTIEPPGKPTEFQFGEDDKVLQIDGLMVAPQYQYTKCH